MIANANSLFNSINFASLNSLIKEAYKVMRNVIRMKSLIYCDMRRARAIAQHLEGDDIETVRI